MSPAVRRRPHYIKAWRKFRGLTQAAVANEIGEKPSSLSQLENGKQGYTQWKLETLARIYDTTPVALLSVDPFSEDQREVDAIWQELSSDGKTEAIEHLRVVHRRDRPSRAKDINSD